MHLSLPLAVNGPDGVHAPDVSRNSTNLHHRFVSVHELHSPVDSGDAALEVWSK